MLWTEIIPLFSRWHSVYSVKLIAQLLSRFGHYLAIAEEIGGHKTLNISRNFPESRRILVLILLSLPPHRIKPIETYKQAKPHQ